MDQVDSRIAEARERFVSLWGQMGSSWGIPRSMAETHALLFVVGEPLNTDDVMEALQISRGSASMTLRALVDWGIVHRVHRKGDRKEYFQAELDVWKMFHTILRERKKREVDPLLESLRACRDLTASKRRIGPAGEVVKAHNARIDDLIAFISMAETISQRFVDPSGKGLRMAAKLLSIAS